jgi:hypothetical protein
MHRSGRQHARSRAQAHHRNPSDHRFILLPDMSITTG